MVKVGRLVVNPSAGAYCRVRLDSGDTILVSHEKVIGRADSLTISVLRWWGFHRARPCSPAASRRHRGAVH